MKTSLPSLCKLATMLGLLLLPFLSFAQQEANIWHIGNGNIMDFNTSPVTVRNEDMNRVHNISSGTYTDKSGKLVFSVSYEGIFNSDGSLMPNGEMGNRISPDDIQIMLKPGEKDVYYVFYVGSMVHGAPEFKDLAVMYTIVDFTGNRSKGVIREKDVVLYSNFHGHFTISAECANGDYWLVGESNESMGSSTDRLLAYRITQEGIAATPVISAPITLGDIFIVKFSPKGNKLVFNNSIWNPGLVLADFDINTGEVSNAFNLASWGWSPEFSPSGDMLYLVTPNIDPGTTILQYDLSSDDAEQIKASRTVIYDGEVWLRDVQLAPDGKIYIIHPEDKALAAIHSPERKGAACNLELKAISLPLQTSYSLPSFPTNFLYAYPLKPDAGPDKEVCMGQPISIGGTNRAGYTYQWEPAQYLSDPNSPTPTFLYTGQLTEAQTLTYVLTVDDGTCQRADAVNITVRPTLHKPKITGSRSVCPAVEGVAYSTVAQPGYRYLWEVVGGQVTTGQGTAAITVNWGPTNAAAQVRVRVTSASGCEGEQTILPVRINIELKPETPQGPETICLNKKDENTYEVINTNGSIYTWGVKGGDITEGQGSSKVTVNWHGLGTHQIWIQEKSVTADTVCYGSSDVLPVHVYQDPALLNLNFVSIIPSTDDTSNLTGYVDGAILNSETIALMRRALGSPAWAEVRQAHKNLVAFTDGGLKADDEVYEYQLQAINDCGELITSTVHRTIRLTGQADYATDQITLNWSAYEGWPAGVTGYEVWGKIDEEKEYRLMRQLDNSTLIVSDLDGAAGFNHRYRIKALAANAAWESWSNEIDFAFEHKLVIPNIFTPNGDGFNDTFYIPKIELYPENELTILSRTGKEVLRLARYNSTWNGDNVVAGTYYYHLYIKRLNTYYKGWVEIMK